MLGERIPVLPAPLSTRAVPAPPCARTGTSLERATPPRIHALKGQPPAGARPGGRRPSEWRIESPRESPACPPARLGCSRAPRGVSRALPFEDTTLTIPAAPWPRG